MVCKLLRVGMRSTQAVTSSADPQAHSLARRTRICFVGLQNLAVLAPQFDGSGAAGEPVQHTLLARALARRGYEVSMVTADGGQPDGATWDGVTIFKAYAPQAGLPLLRFVHPRWTGLWAALSRADADVYYSSCAGGLAGQVAMFCARRGKRYVFRVASDSDCLPDALIIKRWYWRDKRLYQYALKQADAVLAQSVRQQELLLNNFGRRSTLAPLMGNTSGTNLDFDRRDIDALWVSNIRQLKRPDILFDLAAQLPPVSFHLVGGVVPGERPLFDEVQARVRTARNVTFHGPLAYDNANALYARARVFVNTSDMEGFPNTYLQAWASGTPVVAFFDPDGLIAEHGLGIAVRSREEMIAAIRTLLHDATAWNAARARCLAFSQRRFGEDAVLQQYLQVLDSPRTG